MKVWNEVEWDIWQSLEVVNAYYSVSKRSFYFNIFSSCFGCRRGLSSIHIKVDNLLFLFSYKYSESLNSILLKWNATSRGWLSPNGLLPLQGKLLDHDHTWTTTGFAEFQLGPTQALVRWSLNPLATLHEEADDRLPAFYTCLKGLETVFNDGHFYKPCPVFIFVVMLFLFSPICRTFKRWILMKLCSLTSLIQVLS